MTARREILSSKLDLISTVKIVTISAFPRIGCKDFISQIIFEDCSTKEISKKFPLAAYPFERDAYIEEEAALKRSKLEIIKQGSVLRILCT